MNCNIEKVDIAGCLIDEQSFADIVARLCALEEPAVCPVFTPLAAPVITSSGTGSITLQAVLETNSWWRERADCEKREVWEFHYRVRSTQLDDTGWYLLRVDNIAGWDREIEIIGSYRQSGNLNNPEPSNNDTQGAMPDAPYMGQEFTEWSNTGLLYHNQVNSKDNDAIIWSEFKVKYIRI